MGISGFKIVLILAVVAILFLPTFIKRASALSAMLPALRDRLSGEEGGRPAPGPAASRAAEPEAPPPSLAERFGGAAARLGHRLKGRRPA
jgi:hypothetical protein